MSLMSFLKKGTLKPEAVAEKTLEGDGEEAGTQPPAKRTKTDLAVTPSSPKTLNASKKRIEAMAPDAAGGLSEASVAESSEDASQR